MIDRACVLLLFCLFACTSAPLPRPSPARVPAVATRAAIEIPKEPRVRLRERHVVASGLQNPRGMYIAPDGTLWLSEAGTGEADSASGRISELRDRNGDGDYL